MGDAERAAELLERLETLTGTPVARTAALAREKISTCRELEAWCPVDSDCTLLEQLSCRGQEPRLEQAHQSRGRADWLISGEIGSGQRLIARGRTGAEGLTEFEVELPRLEGRSAISLLLPGEDGPGPHLMSDQEALVHFRIRPDGGLNVASMVGEEGWANQMFQLQSELFLAAALKGNWELAVYVPEEGQRIPPAALALDFTNRTAAVAGMERFLEELMQSWPVRKSPFFVGEWPGSCLSNLQIMPDFLPCYVATDRALIVGWNPLSLEKALRPSVGQEDLDQSQVEFFLDRFPVADERLATASGADPIAGSTDYPWRQVRVAGSRQGKSYLLRVTFVPWSDA